MDLTDSYSTQRACLNGHVISNHADLDPQQQPWCDLCGAATIDKCPACNGPLRGEGMYGPVSAFPIPEAYCLHCGKTLPWTEAHFSALREIAEYVDTLNEKDRQSLADLLPDLIATEATPKTELAIVKMKSLLKKGGADFLEAARKILVDVVSEVVNKAPFPK